MEELKSEIIDAVNDSTDLVDGTVSLSILDYLLEGILQQYKIERL